VSERRACRTLGQARATQRKVPRATEFEKRLVARIIERGEGRCLGGFVSWKTWLLILGMMAMGWALRRSGAPFWVIGVLYAGIGTALVTASLTT